MVPLVGLSALPERHAVEIPAPMPKLQAPTEVHVAGGRSAEEGRCACAGSLPPMLAAKTAQRTEAVVGDGRTASLASAHQLGTLRTLDLRGLHSGLPTGSPARVRLEMQDGLVGGFGRAGSAV